ncbi:hypothetical protein ACFW7J_21400 [Streptomyces sp. NPDC059525]|uniref:hypothetical protein n=1 Tax=Streptomyces sp. NPDC059525 TaxID=3346857 RepID=UPI00369ED211
MKEESAVRRRPTTLSTGLVVGLFVLFGVLLCTAWRSSGDGLAQTLAVYLAVAVPGCVFVLWLIRRGRG